MNQKAKIRECVRDQVTKRVSHNVFLRVSSFVSHSFSSLFLPDPFSENSTRDCTKGRANCPKPEKEDREK
jgi:hypothetical protein